MSLHHATGDFHHQIDRLAMLRQMEQPSPANWPTYPFLPLRNNRRKDRYGGPLLGLLFDAKGTLGRCGHEHTVFLASLYDIPQFGGKMSEKDFLATAKQYTSFPAMLADGWLVD